LEKCWVPFKKEKHPDQSQRNSDDLNITANIIFNLAHLGISIEDTKVFDLDTYFELVELETKVIKEANCPRGATQKDIDAFLN
jgi:hypothetical protein